LQREVREEIGIQVKPICILGTAHFYRGNHIPENELLGVVFGCEIDHNVKLRLSVEHDDVCWVTYQQALELLKEDDPSTTWLIRVLKRAEYLRAALPTEVTEYNRKNGFELG
jgi:8-oxo-dGTP pyrophosphatase MutT (NUDIX family)